MSDHIFTRPIAWYIPCITRGENHQALTGNAVAWSHKHILNQVEELKEDEVDEIVGVGVEDSLEEQLEKAFKGCVRIPGVEKLSKNKVEEALEVATKKASARSFWLLRRLKLHSTTISLRWIYRPSTTPFSQQSFRQGKAFWEHLSQKPVWRLPWMTLNRSVLMFSRKAPNWYQNLLTGYENTCKWQNRCTGGCSYRLSGDVEGGFGCGYGWFDGDGGVWVRNGC